MNNRRFGVEIECGSTRFSHHDIGHILRRHRFPIRSVGMDGSGIEVRTRPLQGKDGYKKLQEIMQCLVEEGDCYTSGIDGMHVHHDTPELRGNSYQLQGQLVRSWYNNQNTIRGFVSPERRMSACPLWSNELVQALENGVRAFGRMSLNINAITEHGTIELRLHEGTLEFDRAEAWVKFGQYFISNVLKRKHPLPACDDAAMLLRRIRAPQAAVRRYT